MDKALLFTSCRLTHYNQFLLQLLSSVDKTSLSCYTSTSATYKWNRIKPLAFHLCVDWWHPSFFVFSGREVGVKIEGMGWGFSILIPKTIRCKRSTFRFQRSLSLSPCCTVPGNESNQSQVLWYNNQVYIPNT